MWRGVRCDADVRVQPRRRHGHLPTPGVGAQPRRRRISHGGPCSKVKCALGPWYAWHAEVPCSAVTVASRCRPCVAPRGARPAFAALRARLSERAQLRGTGRQPRYACGSRTQSSARATCLACPAPACRPRPYGPPGRIGCRRGDDVRPVCHGRAKVLQSSALCCGCTSRSSSKSFTCARFGDR